MNSKYKGNWAFLLFGGLSKRFLRAIVWKYLGEICYTMIKKVEVKLYKSVHKRKNTHKQVIHDYDYKLYTSIEHTQRF